MSNPVTFVNVIHVDPENQQEVIDILNEGTEQVISKRPAFISATILASVDKTRVINIARWEHPEDVKATQTDTLSADYARRTAAIAQANPAMSSVVSEFAR